MRVSNDKKGVESGLESAKTGKAREAKEAREARGGRGEAARVASQEKVEVSPRAKEAASARAAAKSAPDVREDKVARLKQSVQDGSYHVDAEKVAGHMVDDHLETMF
jgi:negative regulator of flagellin synthesis FlgM